MTRPADNSFDRALRQLAEWSGELDASANWPDRQFRLLAEAGVLGWVIPREWGGTAISSRELCDGYVRLAEACLTTAFILTQRNGACQRIAGSENEALKAELLPRLARGELFATVGISHLTTSRQHWRTPTVHVEETAAGYRFSGEVPWVTGAPHAQYIVTGGTLDDGRQVLAAIPTNIPGVKVHPPARLLALSASHTASVTLDGAVVNGHYLLAGPVENVMKLGIGAGTGSYSTSALALGLTRGSIARLAGEVARRPELAEIVRPLETECTELAMLITHAVAAEADPSSNAVSEDVCEQAGNQSGKPDVRETIRTRANSLVLRTTQVLLGVSKGAGFVAGHPAEQAVREAMFFLVWSCPQPVLTATLRELVG